MSTAPPETERLPAGAWQRSTTWALAFAAGTTLFVFAFQPQHLSFDSYHYMVLSYLPEVGNAHPLGFGFLLRGLQWISEGLPWGSFPYLFQLWQVGCLGLLLSVGGPAIRTLVTGAPAGASRSFRFGRLALLAAWVVLLLPGIIFLANGYWSEMTALLVVALSALCFERAARGSRIAWVIFAMVSVLGWHVRYQLAFLPLAAIAGTVALGLRGLVGKRVIVTSVVAAAFTFAATHASEKAMGLLWPTIGMADHATGDYLQKSLACRLRCDAKLHEKDCATPEGRRALTSATCTELITEHVSLGRPLDDPADLGATFSRVGVAGTLRWLAIAPITYLGERYFSLEHEGFGFDRNIRILNVHQEELASYGRLLPQVGIEPSAPFSAVVSYLSAAYDAGAFHVLAAISVILAIVVVVLGQSPSGVFMALAGIGTYLVFAYLHPKAPLRYLVQLSAPCLVAATTLLGRRGAAEHPSGPASVALARRLWTHLRVMSGPRPVPAQEGESRGSLEPAEKVAAAVAFAVLALSLLSFPSAATGIHLDHGWSLAAAHFLHTGRQAGVDYVTTYGPLGYLAIVVFYPGLFALKYTWSIVFAVVASAAFTRFMTHIGPRFMWPVWVWLCLSILPHGDVRFVLLMVVTALLHLVEGAWTPRRLVPTATLFALLSLVKFTFLILGVTLLVLIPLAAPRETRARVAAFGTGPYVVALCAFWTLAGQSLLNIPTFIASSFELARGYSGAMSITGPEKYVGAAFQAALLLGLSAVLIPPSAWLRRIYRLGGTIVGVGLFLSWKEGFVRQDPQHQMSYFGYAAFVAMLLVPLGAKRALDAAAPLRMAFLTTATVTALGAFRALSGDGAEAFLRLESARDRAARQIGILLRPGASQAEMQGTWDAQRLQWALPGVKARVGQASVDVASWDQSIAFWNDLNWRPRPVAQGFSAWTSWLAELNGRHLSGTHAPRFVLVRWVSIDRRFPAHDDGAFLIELLRRYQPVFQEKDYLLFERRAEVAPTGTGEIVLRRRLAIGETLQLGLDPAELSTLSVAIDPTWIGVWRRFTYKAPYLGFLTKQGNGEIKRYDLVPELARREFVLTPLVEGNIDFPWVYDGAGRKFEWIRFELDREGRACFGDTVEVTIRRYPGVAAATEVL